MRNPRGARDLVYYTVLCVTDSEQPERIEIEAHTGSAKMPSLELTALR
jgi:hypothetical protein